MVLRSQVFAFFKASAEVFDLQRAMLLHLKEPTA